MTFFNFLEHFWYFLVDLENLRWRNNIISIQLYTYWDTPWGRMWVDQWQSLHCLPCPRDKSWMTNQRLVLFCVNQSEASITCSLCYSQWSLDRVSILVWLCRESQRSGTRSIINNIKEVLMIMILTVGLLSSSSSSSLAALTGFW